LIYTAPDGIYAYDLTTHDQRQIIDNPYPVISLDVSPDGSKIAFVNGTWGHTSYRYDVWDMATGDKIFELVPLDIPGLHQMQVAFNLSSNLLVTSSDQSIQIWDAATGKERHQLPIGAGRFQLSPDGQLVAFNSGLAIVGDLLENYPVSLHEVFHLRHGDRVAFSPDGTMLVTADGEIWSIP